MVAQFRIEFTINNKTCEQYAENKKGTTLNSPQKWTQITTLQT